MQEHQFCSLDQNKLHNIFLSPSTHTPTLFCLQVDVPSLSGDFGIIAQHVPTLAALKPGVVTVHEDDASHKYFVSSGTVTVNSDSSVQILAEEAAPLDR